MIGLIISTILEFHEYLFIKNIFSDKLRVSFSKLNGFLVSMKNICIKKNKIIEADIGLIFVSGLLHFKLILDTSNYTQVCRATLTIRLI